ncbi:MAG: ABC transporter substrate binding protein [Thermodesulfobacteriota bacterium]
MRGRPLLINFLLAALGLNLLLAPPAAAGGARVAVLLSDQEHAYQQPLSHMEAALGMRLPVYSLHGDVETAPGIMTELLAGRPELVVAFGAKAAYVAKTWSREQPNLSVLFAMVLNWQRYHLRETARVAGIAAEVSPSTQLANLAMFSPQMKKLGIIYSEEFTADVVREIRETAALLDIEVVAEAIRDPREFQLAYRKMTDRVDAFWLLADPLIYTLENVSWLKEQCIKDRLICIGQSENIAKAGMLLAVDPDPASIGEQAAALVRAVLDGKKSIEQIGVMQPLGTRVILNMRTAREIGLPIDRLRRDFADTVIDY